jgi:hypothetical protein
LAYILLAQGVFGGVRIARSEPRDKMFFDESVAFAHLAAGHFPAVQVAQQHARVDLEKPGGFGGG